MDPTAALEGARMAADTLAQLLDVDEFDGSAEGDEAVQNAAENLLTNFRSLDDWLSQEGFLPAPWRHNVNHFYEKCGQCHLFVDDNPAAGDGPDIAPLMHLARGDEADEALDGSHEPTHSGLIATLNVWMQFGPVEMRDRFLRAALDYLDQFDARQGDYLGAVDLAREQIERMMS